MTNLSRVKSATLRDKADNRTVELHYVNTEHHNKPQIKTILFSLVCVNNELHKLVAYIETAY